MGKESQRFHMTLDCFGFSNDFARYKLVRPERAVYSIPMAKPWDNLTGKRVVALKGQLKCLCGIFHFNILSCPFRAFFYLLFTLACSAATG